MAVRSKTMSIRFLTLPLLFALFVYSPITIGGVDTGNYRSENDDITSHASKNETLAAGVNSGNFFGPQSLAGADTGNFITVSDMISLIEREWPRIFVDTDFLTLLPSENVNLALEEISESNLIVSSLAKKVTCKEGLSFCVISKSAREVVISFELTNLLEGSSKQYLLTYSL